MIRGNLKLRVSPLMLPKRRLGTVGKGKGKAQAHEIVSSALIPHDITKRLQESHHVAVEPIAPAP